MEEFVREIGAGHFREGFVSICSAREFAADCERWLRKLPAGTRHFGTTAFGDLLVIEPSGKIVHIRTQHGIADTLPVTPADFFDWLVSPSGRDEVLDLPMWEDCFAQLGVDEVLSYTPALALGGSGSWETLETVKVGLYLDMMAGIVLG